MSMSIRSQMYEPELLTNTFSNCCCCSELKNISGCFGLKQNLNKNFRTVFENDFCSMFLFGASRFVRKSVHERAAGMNFFVDLNASLCRVSLVNG